MKNFYKSLTAIALAALVGGGITSAQSKMSLQARMVADDAIGATAAMADGNSTDALHEVPTVGILFGLADGKTADDVKVESLVVTQTIGKVVLAYIDADKLHELAKSPAVTQIELSEKEDADMIHLRQAAQTGISTVHRNIEGPTKNGTDAGLGHPFLGTGVITSLYDNGLDPNHINFRIGDNYETSRVKGVYVYHDNAATDIDSYETPETISTFETENDAENHGTHVLGIMSGSYNGPGYYAEYVFYADADKTLTDSLSYKDAPCTRYVYRNKNVPYYGVAPASDILVGCGPLYTNNMLDMAQKVRDYSKKTGKPAVINFSIGNTVGPKDGSSLFNKSLAEVGKDIIICMSSSNDGAKNGWITKTFTSADNSFRTFFKSADTSGELSSGSMEIWGSDERPFEATVFLYDVTTKKRTDLATIDKPTLKSKRIISSNYNRTSTTVEYLLSDEFDAAFKGYVTLSSSVMSQNNRYCLSASFSSSFVLAGDNMYGNKALCIEVKGVEGQTAYANAKVSYLTFSDTHSYTDADDKALEFKADGFTSGNPDNSVNNLACGANVFVVGNYINRDKYGVLKGVYADRAKGSSSGRVSNAYIPKDISSSSSYATLIDGRKLPHIAMPGGNIVSSQNRYYLKKHSVTSGTSNNNKEYNTAVVDFGGEEYFWFNNSGTSMSSPAFAGVCALFLEADPTLKWDEINDVLKVTCRQDEFTRAKPERFGYGKVDAYAGIKEVLRRSSVAPVYDLGDKGVMVDVTDGNVNVFVADGEQYTATIYNLSGMQVASAQGSDEVAISTGNLAKGVYVVNVRSPRFNKSTKVVVR